MIDKNYLVCRRSVSLVIQVNTQEKRNENKNKQIKYF